MYSILINLIFQTYNCDIFTIRNDKEVFVSERQGETVI